MMTKRTGRPAGRPSHEDALIPLPLRVHKVTPQKIREAAAMRGITMAQWLREAIEEKLQREQRKPKQEGGEHGEN